MARTPFAPDAPEQESAIDRDYDDKFNRAEELKQLEGLQSIRDNHPDAVAAREGLKTSKDEDVQKQEESQTYPWDNKTSPQTPRPEKRSLRGLLKANKKKGPIAAVISILIVGIVSFVMLTPGLLVIHVVETITEGMNMQGGSMDVRTAKVYASMMKDTSGYCTNFPRAGGIRCKFRSMNDSHIKKLEDAGIKVIVNGGETITGRKKVDALEYKGKTITASNLSMEIKTNDAFRSAARNAYNPWFAGFADKTWAAAATRLGISKKMALGPELKTDEERDAKVREITKEGQNAGDPGTKYRYDEETDKYYDGADNEVDRAMAEAHNNAVDRASELGELIGEVDESGEKLTPKVLEAAHDALDNPSRVVDPGTIARGVTGGVLTAPDSACTFYGLYNAVSFGAKTIRAVQMARYAMIFLNTASAMKAGEISPEDAAYIGNLLTKTVNEEVTDEDGNVTTRLSKAATDSYGYRYVAYGDTGPLTPSAAEFTAGGGLGGKMTGIANEMLAFLPGSKKASKEAISDACGIIKNPFVQAGSAILSVGLIFTGPIGWGALAASLSLGIVSEIALSIASNILTPIITDMVAGTLVDDTTFGERTGDALISGSGVIMSTVAGMGGNAPLRPEEAVAYMNGTQSEALALYKEEDRLQRSPLDPTSPNTFLGSITSQLLPYTGKTSSLTSIGTTSFTVVSRSLKSILNPFVSAAEQTSSTYTQCDDEEYKRLNLATDPFCNPIRGIPSQYLIDDPIDIINRLIENGSIDEDTGAPRTDTDNGEKYSNFIKDCINRQDPLGYSGENFDQDDGSKCFIENSDGITAQMKADWYVYTIDQRILDGIDNGYATSSLNCGPFGGGSGGSVGGKMSESEFKQLFSTYGLPDPQPQTSQDLIQYGAPVMGYEELLQQLKDDPKAAWATQAMLNGEKKWKTAGGEIKDYLNTTWVWFENGQSSWPDPYEMNCVNVTSVTASHYCPSTNFQAAGYQPNDVRPRFKEVYDKLYSEDELASIMQAVIENSTNASKDVWNYNDPSNAGKAGYFSDFSGVTFNDLWPAKPFGDEKAQIQSLILGKDPNMAAALNTFAVSDSDVLAHIGTGEGCGPGWGHYICKPARQQMANMMMALYMFDGQGPSGGASCTDSGAGPLAPNDRDNDSLGIQSIVKGSTVSMVYEMQAGGEDCGLYEYALQYGLTSCVHTGTDILVPPEAPIYTPISGTVRCARTGDSPGTNGGGCAAFADVYGQGAGRIEIEMDSGDVLILGHISKSLVTSGQRVKAGDQVGTNGGMNSWHVHVEYRIPDSSTPSGWRIIFPEDGLGGKVIKSGGVGPTP